LKADLVAQVLDAGHTQVDVARRFGVPEATLGRWLKQARIDRGEAEGLTTDERARLRDLEAECARLRTERELLKRAVAFWVKESTP
jgi:transposase